MSSVCFCELKKDYHKIKTEKEDDQFLKFGLNSWTMLVQTLKGGSSRHNSPANNLELWWNDYHTEVVE